MKGKWLLWLVAAMIGTALTFPPAIISAAEKKGEEKMEKEEKGEKGEKKAKKKAEKGDEKMEKEKKKKEEK